eukprot:8911037-Alexandrium_andersonii.AAC.1
MSASLVGSEMCIRDSPTTWGSIKSGTDPIRNLEVLRRAGFPTFSGLLACLLYTSDAADDM